MKTEAYIRSASCISPQVSFGVENLTADIKTWSANKLNVVEPDYKSILPGAAARRMSRLIKMGVSAGLDCLKRAGIEKPDAIIAGTGLGCMEDSEKFLASLITNNEQILSPTSFIFSTHNTVAGQIALLLQCNSYNFTHTHRGLSFENALLDALLYLADNQGSSVLAGASDEVSETSFTLLHRLGALKKDPVESSGLFKSGSSGAVAGEGSAFFVLGSEKKEGDWAKLTGLFSFTGDTDSAKTQIEKFGEEHQLTGSEFILTGMNGDAVGDAFYSELLQNVFNSNPSGAFKHLCGEYHTATAFACWLAAGMLKNGIVPPAIIQSGAIPSAPEKILIVNHYKLHEYALILLGKC